MRDKLYVYSLIKLPYYNIQHLYLFPSALLHCLVEDDMGFSTTNQSIDQMPGRDPSLGDLFPCLFHFKHWNFLDARLLYVCRYDRRHPSYMLVFIFVLERRRLLKNRTCSTSSIFYFPFVLCLPQSNRSGAIASGLSYNLKMTLKCADAPASVASDAGVAGIGVCYQMSVSTRFADSSAPALS